MVVVVIIIVNGNTILVRLFFCGRNVSIIDSALCSFQTENYGIVLRCVRHRRVLINQTVFRWFGLFIFISV